MLRDLGRLFFKSRFPVLAIALPTCIAALFTLSIDHLVFVDGKRESIAGEYERAALAVSLGFSSYNSDRKDLLVVEGTDTDFRKFGFESPRTRFRDLSAETYYSVLSAILNEPSIEKVYVSMMYNAHDFRLGRYDRIFSLLEENSSRAYFTFPLGHNLHKPNNISKIYRSSDCFYDVQTICTHNPQWDWIIGRIIQDFSGDSFAASVTKNLPHALPSFVLNLPLASSIPKVSFEHVLKNGIGNEVRAVFIGPNIRQIVSSSGFDSQLGITQSASDKVWNGGIATVPLHIFWSQLSTMLLMRKTPQVAPAWTEMVVSAILCLALVGMLYRFSVFACFVTLLGIAALFPLLNVILIKFFGFYIPVFLSVYYLAMLLFNGAFVSLSIRAFHFWMIQQSTLLANDAKVTRGHFISLISHDLLTPVARMVSSLDLLRSRLSSTDRSSTDTAADIRKRISEMHFTLRTLLFLASDFGVSNSGSRSLRASEIAKVITDTHGALIESLGLNFGVRDGDQTVDVRQDARLIAHLVFCIVLRISRILPGTPLKCEIYCGQGMLDMRIYLQNLTWNNLTISKESILQTEVGDTYPSRILTRFLQVYFANRILLIKEDRHTGTLVVSIGLS